MTRTTGHDLRKTIERMLFFRDQCLEWASINHIPTDLKFIAETQAAIWDELATNIERDAKLIADSRARIAAADELLKQ